MCVSWRQDELGEGRAVREHERLLQGAALRAAERGRVQVHAELRRPCGAAGRTVSERVDGRGSQEGRGPALTPALPLAHTDPQLGAHARPERLPRASAPGPELVQHARQSQRLDQFHGACGERALGGREGSVGRDGA